MLQSYGIYSPYSILLWGMAILLQLYCGVKYFSIGLKQGKNKENIILKGFTVFLICWAIAYVFWFFANFELSLSYDNRIFYGNRENTPPNFIIMDKIGGSFYVIGYTSLFYCFEKIFRITRFSITIVNIIVLILCLFLPYDSFVGLFSFMAVVNICIFYIMLLFLTKWSRPEFKVVSAMFSFGNSLIAVGIMLFTPVFLSLSLFPLILIPIFIIIGNVFFLLPTIINPDKILMSKLFWIFALAGGNSIAVVMVIISFPYLPIELGISYVAAIILFFILGYFVIKDVITKPDTLIPEREKLKPTKDILAVFTRPQKITEEEVSISKEKKICLVCKGNVVGKSFICFKCGAFYCIKCFNALTNLENACWACDNALDKSKPVKLTKEKEPETRIEADIPKKSEGKGTKSKKQ